MRASYTTAEGLEAGYLSLTSTGLYVKARCKHLDREEKKKGIR